MPEIFPFIPGLEAAQRLPRHDTSPLLGRFRAVPRSSGPSGRMRRASQQQLDLLTAGNRGSVHVGYGALVALGLENDSGSSEEDSDEDGLDSMWGTRRRGRQRSEEREGGTTNGIGRWFGLGRGRRRARRVMRKGKRKVVNLWIEPRQGSVRRVVERWWSRWAVLVFLPAAVAVAWCAIPIPQYPIPSDSPDKWLHRSSDRAPGHGAARVQLNFWVFLLAYYGFYNITALIWITKVFNLYSLNWWPSALGFPLTVSLMAILSITAPIPFYTTPSLRFLTVHNTAWVSWTFIVMSAPVAMALCIMVFNERHLDLRLRSYAQNETQRIFTSSWWTEDSDRQTARGEARYHDSGSSALAASRLHPESGASLQFSSVPSASAPTGLSRMTALMRRRWLPASFVRFMWFCLALTVGLLAYLIGETYAEIYLRTLPHNNLETIVYVYSWVVTVHLLDMVTGWILGASEGDRVGSYPLSWVFKLYFTLTYQTYVRALYARLRSPQQFILLQALSSSTLILLVPFTMTRTYHRFLRFLYLSGQSYASYQKICVRNVFIRLLAENTSMLAFLGSIAVLHFGPNRDVYPYFAFDDPDEAYNFNLTFYAAVVTWACELLASVVLRALVWWGFGIEVVKEGWADLAVWPELLPTCGVAMLHVLQNMLFSIVRLRF